MKFLERIFFAAMIAMALTPANAAKSWGNSCVFDHFDKKWYSCDKAMTCGGNAKGVSLPNSPAGSCSGNCTKASQHQIIAPDFGQTAKCWGDAGNYFGKWHRDGVTAGDIAAWLGSAIATVVTFGVAAPGFIATAAMTTYGGLCTGAGTGCGSGKANKTTELFCAGYDRKNFDEVSMNPVADKKCDSASGKKGKGSGGWKWECKPGYAMNKCKLEKGKVVSDPNGDLEDPLCGCAPSAAACATNKAKEHFDNQFQLYNESIHRIVIVANDTKCKYECATTGYAFKDSTHSDCIACTANDRHIVNGVCQICPSGIMDFANNKCAESPKDISRDQMKKCFADTTKSFEDCINN